MEQSDLESRLTALEVSVHKLQREAKKQYQDLVQLKNLESKVWRTFEKYRQATRPIARLRRFVGELISARI